MNEDILQILVENAKLLVKVEKSNWDYLLQLLPIVLGIINLVLIIILFYKDKKTIQENTLREKEKQYKLDWFNMVGHRCLHDISNINQTLKDAFIGYTNHNDKDVFATKIIEIDEMLTKHKVQIQSTVKLIDQNSVEQVCGCFLEFQDCYLKEFDSLIRGAKNRDEVCGEIHDEFDGFTFEIINNIFSFGEKIINN